MIRVQMAGRALCFSAGVLAMALASDSVRADTPPVQPNQPGMELQRCTEAADKLEQLTCDGAGRARCLGLRDVIDAQCPAAGQHNRTSRAATILKEAAQRDCTKSLQSLAAQIGTGTCRGLESECDKAKKICAEADDGDALKKLAAWTGNGAPTAPPQAPNPTAPQPPPFPAAVVEKCQPQLEKLVDAVLDNKPGDARAIYQVRFLTDSDCRPYLTEKAKAIGAVLPAPDDVAAFALALAPKVSPKKWEAFSRAKQEREQCRSTISDFIQVLGQRRIRTELDSEHVRAADADFEALRKTIIASVPCHRLCLETPDCRTGIADKSEFVVVRLADGTCSSVSVESLATLEAGATILLTPAEVMSSCRSQIGAGPARPPETKATGCASWHPEARIDEVANVDQRQPQGTCSVRNLTSDQCTAIGGTKFKPDSGSGFTECFRSVASAPPTVATPPEPRIATPPVKPQQPSVTAPTRPPAMDLSNIAKTPNSLCRAGTQRFVSATRPLSLAPARYCTDSDWNVRNVRAIGAQLRWTVPFTDGAVECSCTRSSGPSVQTPTVTTPSVRTPAPPTVTTPNVRAPAPPTVTTPAVRGPASCAAKHPNARVDETANTDQRQPQGTCSVRNITPSECTALGGHHFKPDNGSGFTECFFNARGAAPNPAVRNAPAPVVHWGAIAAGIDEGERARVGVGIAWNHASREAAEEAALTHCRSRANSCVIKDTFHGKGTCGYVTTGRDSEGRVGWGSGPTSARAHSNCEGEGLECQTPIGGCNQ